MYVLEGCLAGGKSYDDFAFGFDSEVIDRCRAVSMSTIKFGDREHEDCVLVSLMIF